MKQDNWLRWSRLPILAGGLVWMVGSAVLALRPGGHPPDTFRASLDVMPVLGLGLFLIGSSLGVQSLRLPHRGERSFYVAATFFLIGSVFYPVGTIVRLEFMKGAWEPLMPIGYLLVVAGCLLYGITTLITRLLSKTVSVLLMAAALSLLAFNDQYAPWMGSVFGLVVTGIGCTGACICKRRSKLHTD